MPGFFPHISTNNLGYTSLGNVTFSATLASIVADVGVSGVNGWTVHDDQRETTTNLIPTMVGGAQKAAGTYFLTFTNNRVGFNGASNQTEFYAQFLAHSGSGTQITTDLGSNYYTVSTFFNTISATLDRVYAGATTSAHYVYEKPQGYIVLKCTDSQKTFYLKIDRPNTYGHFLRFQTFENWNNTTHSGTTGGPQEVMRAYDDGRYKTAQSKVSYIMWLLPGAFAMWGGGDPSEASTLPTVTTYNDFFYVGNLTPFRAGDTNCLYQASSNTMLSGLWVQYNSVGTSYDSNGGAAVMLRDASGANTWTDLTLSGSAATFPTNCIYAPHGRGKWYVQNGIRTNVDLDGRFEICDIEAWPAGPRGAYQDNETKRGTIKYVKLPVSNPNGMHLVSFGPCDDGNTYIMVRCSYPPGGGVAGPTTENTTVVTTSGWVQQGGFNVTSAGELSYTTSPQILLMRFLLMPINI